MSTFAHEAFLPFDSKALQNRPRIMQDLADFRHLARVLDFRRHGVHWAGRHAQTIRGRPEALAGGWVLDDACRPFRRPHAGHPVARHGVSAGEARLGATSLPARLLQPVLRRRQDRTGSRRVLTPERGLGSGLRVGAKPWPHFRRTDDLRLPPGTDRILVHPGSSHGSSLPRKVSGARGGRVAPGVECRRAPGAGHKRRNWAH